MARLYWLAILAICCVSTGFVAEAQVNNNLTPTNNPGAILEGTKSPVLDRPVSGANEEEDVLGRPAKDDAPIITDDMVDAPRLDESLIQPIFIKDIEIEGNTLLDGDYLNELVAPYVGKETPLNELREQVADTITKAYEDQGYVTSAAFIPPQTIDGGILKVQIEEGIVSAVTYKEQFWFRDQAIKPRMLTDQGDVFQVNELVKDIRRINENPDITLAATLRSGENSGETEVILENTQPDRPPIHLTPYVDNLGRQSIGQIRAGFTANVNNVTSLGDTLYSTNAWSREAYSTVNGYELPIGPHGTKVGISHGYSVFDFQTGGARFNGDSNITNAYVKQEFFRNENWKVEGEVGFSVKSSRTEVNGSPLAEDKLRVLTQALNIQEFDRFGRTYMRHELAQGFDLFGATLGTENGVLTAAGANPRAYQPSRPGAGSQFFRYTTSTVRSQRVAGPTYAIFKFLGQVTPDPLASLEAFQVGGTSTVRGYREGRLLGDSGFVLSAEYRVPFFFLPDSWAIPKTNYRFKDSLEFVSFVDAGAAFQNEIGVVGTTGVNSLRPAGGKAQAYALGAGVGFRARLTQYLNARIDVGFPLIESAPDGETARLHFGVESRLF